MILYLLLILWLLCGLQAARLAHRSLRRGFEEADIPDSYHRDDGALPQ